jgi:hypothetical protein
MPARTNTSLGATSVHAVRSQAKGMIGHVRVLCWRAAPVADSADESAAAVRAQATEDVL